METRKRVSNFAVKDKPREICEDKECIRNSIDRGKVIVVVSPTETKPLASNEHLKNKKINNNMSFLDVISSMHSLEEKNFDNDDDDVDDDDKENVKIKRISSESKQSCGSREVDKIFPRQQQRTQANRSPKRKSTSIQTLLCIDNNKFVDATAVGVKRKIPRPANAFMLFANEWRRKLAAENPRESNKDISVRLGIFWKNMSKDVKEKYFALAREVDREHKRKYPGMYPVTYSSFQCGHLHVANDDDDDDGHGDSSGGDEDKRERSSRGR
ncbi:PREDICTED: putative transcription factor capicua [Cyphomyrmex costatus]|uniref:putative transcription factor capicua n=1 Tax=Cyphomyrmex costatus TaxID=456900 RepID=UPI0008523A68|nr:PREDICTED: putative transcription factor capicua [Cyphomyrmex costatus]